MLWPEIIAHCGASAEAPENTLASVSLAWQLSADAVEVDIHLSHDENIVVMHDKNTRRTTGFDAEISALSLDELRKLNAGAWKSAGFVGEKVPTLDEVLSLLPAKKRLFIELKAGSELIIPLQNALNRSQITPGQITLIGFDFALMKAAKAALPNFAAFWLRGADFGKRGQLDVSSLVEQSIQLCHEAHLDGLNLSRDWFAQRHSERALRRVRESGLKLCVYTINNGVFARRCAEIGVDGITTDRPGYLRAGLQEKLPFSVEFWP